MRGREEELAEVTHRHPSAWWDERYKWLHEGGEPREPDYRSCGRNVRGLGYMTDEFPEQAPNEKTRLHCLLGQKQVILPCLEVEEDEFCFPEVASNLKPAEFLRTQREKFEAARLRVLAARRNQGKRKKTKQVRKKLVRQKVKRKLLRTKRKDEMKEFLAEVRAREGEGYSARQLMSSLIPDIGTELKVREAEVTAAVKAREVAFPDQPPEIIIYFLFGAWAYLRPRGLVGGSLYGLFSVLISNRFVIKNNSKNGLIRIRRS